MSEYTTYTIGYRVVGTNLTTVEIVYKANTDVGYTSLVVNAPQPPNPAPNPAYTYTTPPNLFYKHRMYTIRTQTLCDARVLIGDLAYLITQQCNDVSAVVVGSTIDVTWDSWTPPSGDSVKEYRIEYKEVGSPGPYYVETIPMSTIVADWTANSTYPSYTFTLTTGILPAASYEINFYTVIEYNYYADSGVAQAQITIGPCPVTGSFVTALFETLEDDNTGIQENNNFSILEQ